MPVSRSLLRHRILAIIATFAMVACICGFTAHGFSHQPSGSDHCDWTMHFTGVAGSAPKPVPIARPVRAAWLPPSIHTDVPHRARRLRAHLARGPPVQLLPAPSAA